MLVEMEMPAIMALMALVPLVVVVIQQLQLQALLKKESKLQVERFNPLITLEPLSP